MFIEGIGELQQFLIGGWQGFQQAFQEK